MGVLVFTVGLTYAASCIEVTTLTLPFLVAFCWGFLMNYLMSW